MGFFFDDEELGLSVGVTDAVELEVGDSEVVDAVVESGLLENCTSFTIPDSDVVDPVFFLFYKPYTTVYQYKIFIFGFDIT